ncbi:hypothetical protein EDC04DRAFT_2804376 [Pisolithus marmoratus]|nr:hypothetical protein EDC04DRAFT_2804376 [Pisolithus marmoratus]
MWFVLGFLAPLKSDGYECLPSPTLDEGSNNVPRTSALRWLRAPSASIRRYYKGIDAQPRFNDEKSKPNVYLYS